MSKLSELAIKKAKAGATPFKMTDGGGLFLLVIPAGGKYWRMAYRFGGKQKTLALGVYPDVSLADARLRHYEARKLRFLRENSDWLGKQWDGRVLAVFLANKCVGTFVGIEKSTIAEISLATSSYAIGSMAPILGLTLI